MAVVLMEGFDHLSAAQLNDAKSWTAVTNGFVSVGAGVLGGQYARTANGTETKALPSSYSTIYAGFRWRGSLLTVGTDRFVFRSGATLVCRLQTATSGPNTVFRLVNAAGTTLATGTTGLAVDTWYYIEIKLVVHGSTGTVELRLNGLGSAEMSGTGLNTGSSNVDAVQLGFQSGGNFDFDDLYVLDTSGSSPTNDWLGDVRVQTLAPTGNGTNTAWTGAFGDWDDGTSHNTDTDYVSSSTPGDKETSTLADLSSSGTVFAVQTNLLARKDDAGTRTIAPVLRIGSTDYDGTTTSGLSTGYLDYTQLYDRLDPSGAAWTSTTVNAMEAGVKEIA